MVTKAVWEIKSLSPFLQSQVKKAITRLSRSRPAQKISRLQVFAHKQFVSRTKPLFSFRIKVQTPKKSFVAKSSGRQPFEALSRAIRKTRTLLKKLKN